jgi:aryl-alcohol dehydrogenase-like predicted oxidoreductase
MTEADKEIIGRVEELAGKKGWKMSHVALAWLVSKGAASIVGLTPSRGSMRHATCAANL